MVECLHSEAVTYRRPAFAKSRKGGTMKGLAALFAVLVGFAGVFPAGGQDKAPPKVNLVNLSPDQQESYLAGLIPEGKEYGTVYALLLVFGSIDVNQRTVCSGSGSGTARPSYNGSETYDVNIDTDSVCRELHDVRNRVVLAMPDAGAAQTGHLIFMECTTGFSKGQKGVALGTMGYGALFMHKHGCFMQEGPKVGVVLKREKHEQWSVYVSTQEKLGGKSRLSKYDVAMVKTFEVAKVTGAPQGGSGNP